MLILVIFFYSKIILQEYLTGSEPNNSLASFTVFDFANNEDLKDKLGLKSGIKSNSKIKWQTETCICDLGDRCNSGTRIQTFWSSIMIGIFLMFLITV